MRAVVAERTRYTQRAGEEWPGLAVRERVSETPLARPALSLDTARLRAHFEDVPYESRRPLENPHLEPRVSDAERARATPSAVLIAVVDHALEPTVVVTTRPESISFPGHVVFPGGRADSADATPLETALREAEEEIGLPRARVEVLGRLGDYVTHSGFRIAPVVALVAPPVEFVAQQSEVAAIHEVPLARLLDPGYYQLVRRDDHPDRAYFVFEDDDLVLAGATVSLCISLYRELAEWADAR